MFYKNQRNKTRKQTFEQQNTMGSFPSKKAENGASGSTLARGSALPEPSHSPFFDKDSSRIDVLVHHSDSYRRYLQRQKGQASSVNVLELFKAQAKGGDQTHVETKTMDYIFTTQTLSVSGFRLVQFSPEDIFSRMRNLKADALRFHAHANADAFVYRVDVANEEEYFFGGKNGNRAEWERDRSEIFRLLSKPASVENPHKPFLLLVHDGTKEEKGNHNGTLLEDLDLNRLVNLFGLSKIQRPFHVTSFTSRPGDQRLADAFEWLRQTAHGEGSENEDTTAATQSVTHEGDDEGSVTTISTRGTHMEEGATEAYVLDYDPTLQGGNPTLHRFDCIKKKTHCPFARAAKLWGGKVLRDDDGSFRPRLYSHRDSTLDIEAAILNAGPLAEFVARVKEGERLDGFCLELPAPSYCPIEELGRKVNRILTKLAENDPAFGENAMKMGPVDHPSWRFRFAEEDFFITTFSPVYPKESSRHTFGAHASFILFQPMTSFGRHGLTSDTPASATNWTYPTSMRDKARVAFRENGCPYHIPETLPYPAAEHIVKPEIDDGTSIIKWWETLVAKSD